MSIDERPGRGLGCALRLATAFLPLLAGCTAASPVRVVPRKDGELHRSLDTCALYGNLPSARTAWLLELLEAEEQFREDPIAALQVVHERARQEGSRQALFAMAELSFLAGKRRNSEECFLAAAAYAYLYLLGGDGMDPPSPWDRRFRWACDIYNRSLVRALEDPHDGSLRIEGGRRALPVGHMDVDVDLSGFPFQKRGLELLPADDLDVLGLDFRVRDSGLGAPLIAVVQRKGEGTAGLGILDETSVSATLFLRIEGGIGDMASGLSAVLELHSTYEATAVDVSGVQVPLESDVSATIAYGIDSSNVWRYGVGTFFQGRDAMRQNGLILPRPFEAGRIPVVLVHGTASNPAYWADLWNSLEADDLIRKRFQFWLFIYTTGNPVVYSAATLREALLELVTLHDPEGRDPGLQHMVVVGHSQGGLLAKFTAVHVDADEAAQRILGSPVEELGLDAEGEELLRRCFDVEPLPFVDRVVFLATPHRGSFLSTRWYSRLFAKLVAVPVEFEQAVHRLVRNVPEERLPAGMAERVPTSLDNMDPSNSVLLFLADVPVDPRVHAHSIIPIGREREPEGANDGVVAYESAHLEGVDSEVLVPSPHSCQSHPRTIVELRRILREHVRTVDAAAAAAAAAAADGSDH